MRLPRIPLITLAALVVLQQTAPAQQSFVLSLFERYLDALRQQAGIPGLSVAIVQNQQIMWAGGLGMQDLEGSVRASPNTPYPITDLTETFAATLVMQCAERGSLDLNAPIRQWTSIIPEPDATVRDVLIHSSDAGALGSFRFDPSRFAALTPVIADCGHQPFSKVVAREILDRLGMDDSVPGRELLAPTPLDAQLFEPAKLERYGTVLRRLALPYKVDGRGRASRSEFPAHATDASTGLVSTVRDLARFDAALDDDGVLLEADTLAKAWTNATSRGGVPLPSGLGWFVQTYNGERVVWHFGLAKDAFSSLVLKVPGRDLTLILLANSDGLSAPFGLHRGDVNSSLFAKLFLRLFVV